MGNNEFLEKLRLRLSGIPQVDADERVSFYSEMIDDRIEEGLTEEQAVAELGSVDEIATQILSEVPLTAIVKEKVKPNRALRLGEIILLILGSPIWLSLLLALFAVIVSVYVTIWSVIVAIWAVDFSFAVVAVSGIFSLFVFSAMGKVVSGIAMLGVGIAFVGITILGFLICLWVTKAIIWATKWVFLKIKSGLIRKETA
ncbi:MAG: DUF1700 domain-containing protein [Oscillospiraceae bacterium]|nr:DUF1700 domain-containing protein [Oscillospiraceae bacterium]